MKFLDYKVNPKDSFVLKGSKELISWFFVENLKLIPTLKRKKFLNVQFHFE
jgi:hypothetical protein